jgi:hypothetical protein
MHTASVAENLVKLCNCIVLRSENGKLMPRRYGGSEFRLEWADLDPKTSFLSAKTLSEVGVSEASHYTTGSTFGKRRRVSGLKDNPTIIGLKDTGRL